MRGAAFRRWSVLVRGHAGISPHDRISPQVTDRQKIPPGHDSDGAELPLTATRSHLPRRLRRAGRLAFSYARRTRRRPGREGMANVFVRTGRGRMGGAAEEARSVGRDSACSADRPRSDPERLGEFDVGPPQPASAAAADSRSTPRGTFTDTPDPMPYSMVDRVLIPSIRVDAPAMPVGLDTQGWVDAPPPGTRTSLAGSPARSPPARRARPSSSAMSTTIRAPPCSTGSGH